MTMAMFLRRLVFAAVIVMVASTSTAVQPAEGQVDVEPAYWPRPIHWPWTPSPPPPAPPSPPVDPWYCNRTYGPEDYSGAEEDSDDCPPPPPPAWPPQHCGWPCICPRLPPRPRPASAASGCERALSAVKACGAFVVGDDDMTPSIGSRCCSQIRSVLNSTTAAADRAAARGGDDAHLQKCLCPVVLGDVAGVLPKPLDPLRLLYLPVACGFDIPAQMLYLCYSGKAAAPVVGSFSELGK